MTEHRYAGALAALLNFDMDILRGMLTENFVRKPALMDSNQNAVAIGFDYARAPSTLSGPVRLAPLDRPRMPPDRRNTAAALGGLYAGATVAAWYPITRRRR